MESKFRVDDLVWAKMRGYPAWPARISEHPKGKSGPSNRLYVFFYGTHQYAWMSPNDLCPYGEYKSSLHKPSNKKGYSEAVWEVEEDPELSISSKVKTPKRKVTKKPPAQVTNPSLPQVTSPLKRSRKRRTSPFSQTTSPSVHEFTTSVKKEKIDPELILGSDKQLTQTLGSESPLPITTLKQSNDVETTDPMPKSPEGEQTQRRYSTRRRHDPDRRGIVEELKQSYSARKEQLPISSPTKGNPPNLKTKSPSTQGNSPSPKSTIKGKSPSPTSPTKGKPPSLRSPTKGKSPSPTSPVKGKPPSPASPHGKIPTQTKDKSSNKKRLSKRTTTVSSRATRQSLRVQASQEQTYNLSTTADHSTDVRQETNSGQETNTFGQESPLLEDSQTKRMAIDELPGQTYNQPITPPAEVNTQSSKPSETVPDTKGQSTYSTRSNRKGQSSRNTRSSARQQTSSSDTKTDPKPSNFEPQTDVVVHPNQLPDVTSTVEPSNTSTISSLTCGVESKDTLLEARSDEPTCGLESKDTLLEARSDEPTCGLQSKDTLFEVRSDEPTCGLESKDTLLEVRSNEPTCGLKSKDTLLEARSDEPTCGLESKDTPLEARSNEPTCGLESKDTPLEARSNEPTCELESKDTLLEVRSNEPTLQTIPAHSKVGHKSSESTQNEKVDLEKESASDLKTAVIRRSTRANSRLTTTEDLKVCDLSEKVVHEDSETAETQMEVEKSQSNKLESVKNDPREVDSTECPQPMEINSTVTSSTHEPSSESRMSWEPTLPIESDLPMSVDDTFPQSTMSIDEDQVKGQTAEVKVQPGDEVKGQPEEQVKGQDNVSPKALRPKRRIKNANTREGSPLKKFKVSEPGFKGLRTRRPSGQIKATDDVSGKGSSVENVPNEVASGKGSSNVDVISSASTEPLSQTQDKQLNDFSEERNPTADKLELSKETSPENGGTKDEQVVGSIRGDVLTELPPFLNPQPGMSIVQILQTYNYNLKAALTVEAPNPSHALATLKDLQDLHCSAGDVEKVPDLVSTIRKLKHYKASPKVMKESENVYLKLKKLFAFPYHVPRPQQQRRFKSAARIPKRAPTMNDYIKSQNSRSMAPPTHAPRSQGISNVIVNKPTVRQVKSANTPIVPNVPVSKQATEDGKNQALEDVNQASAPPTRSTRSSSRQKVNYQNMCESAESAPSEEESGKDDQTVPS